MSWCQNLQRVPASRMLASFRTKSSFLAHPFKPVSQRRIRKMTSGLPLDASFTSAPVKALASAWMVLLAFLVLKSCLTTTRYWSRSLLVGKRMPSMQTPDPRTGRVPRSWCDNQHTVHPKRFDTRQICQRLRWHCFHRLQQRAV